MQRLAVKGCQPAFAPQEVAMTQALMIDVAVGSPPAPPAPLEAAPVLVEEAVPWPEVVVLVAAPPAPEAAPLLLCTATEPPQAARTIVEAVKEDKYKNFMLG